MSTKTAADLAAEIAKANAWGMQARAACDRYEQMAATWWARLTDQQRAAWLDAAEFDGRERHPVAAFTLMGDVDSGAPVLYVYPTEAGEFGAQVVDGSTPLCGLHAPTEAELMDTAEGQGYGTITRVRVDSLTEVPGFSRG